MDWDWERVNNKLQIESNYLKFEIENRVGEEEMGLGWELKKERLHLLERRRIR